MRNGSSSIVARLESALGPTQMVSDAATCANYAVDEMTPSAVATPSSAEEIAELVRFAAREKLALIPSGARTKLRIGMTPARYDIALDMSALNKIAHYDPGDLTLGVDAGTPIAKLNATLFEHQQFLPLLVPWYSLTTIGGTIASGIDSPLCQFYGTGRDFLIGAEFIDGTGKLCKSGGRVVKNVTGYDLHKLLIGSLGTLAVITRLNFRTFPAPLAGSRGFVASFPNAEGALTLRRAVAQSSLTPLTFDIVSPALAQLFASRTPATLETAVFADENRNTNPSSLQPVGDWFRPHEWQLCAAFAGAPEVLDRYARDLRRFATESCAASLAFLDEATRPAVWGRLRETLSLLLEFSPEATVFKISVLPSQYGALFLSLRQIADQAGLPHALVARRGGTIYFTLLPTSANDETTRRVAQAAIQIFQLVSAADGDATLLFATPALNVSANIRGSSRSDITLMRKLKSAFDPQGIFAPGRFSSGLF
jgi:glycolate oxidase FAD binding subunit